MTARASRVAFVGLGANLGEREATLRAAARRIGESPGVLLLRASSLYETAAVGGPEGQPHYLNAALAVETELDPEALLARLLEIERALGRVRGPERDAPRTIDIDLLLHGDAVVRRGEDCVVPHPRIAERAFVLAPLAEIAPDARVPGAAGGTSVAELLALADSSQVLGKRPFLESAETAK